MRETAESVPDTDPTMPSAGSLFPMEGPTVGSRIGTHYRVVERLGAGGMGIVLRAQDERLERDVAIKLIRPELLSAPGAQERFLNEARAMARVAHPGVVSIHAFASADEPPYFVMEFVPGSDLQSLIDARGFSPAEALRVLAPLCEAVDAIHKAGFVHRDLKPRNILVGPGLRIVVTDLGLAHALESAQGLSAEGPAGTPGYIAPELVLEGRQIRYPERIDVYALGALTYRLLVGCGAHEADTDEDVVDSQLRTKPPPPSARNGSLPQAIDDVLARALSVDPSRRQPSAEVFYQELRQALGSNAEPVRRVVLADDDEDMRTWLATVLSAAMPGSQLVSVSDGSAALTAVEDAPTDLLITDLNMPALDGTALTRALRERRPDLPILVITAVGGAPEWKLLRELGANAFLPKPLDADTIEATIARLLK